MEGIGKEEPCGIRNFNYELPAQCLLIPTQEMFVRWTGLESGECVKVHAVREVDGEILLSI